MAKCVGKKCTNGTYITGQSVDSGATFTLKNLSIYDTGTWSCKSGDKDGSPMEFAVISKDTFNLLISDEIVDGLITVSKRK